MTKRTAQTSCTRSHERCRASQVRTGRCRWTVSPSDEQRVPPVVQSSADLVSQTRASGKTAWRRAYWRRDDQSIGEQVHCDEGADECDEEPRGGTSSC